MTCAEAEILLHALLDGELDAGHAREVETHLETCPRCAAQLRRVSRAAAGHAGRAAALYGADEPAPAHRDGAAVGAPARLEPPLRAEGLCHGLGTLGCDGGDPRRRSHSNRSRPARARRRRLGACALASGRAPHRRADERPAHRETVVQRQGRRRTARRRPDSPGLQADRRAARLSRRQGRRFHRLSASDACDQSLHRAGSGLRNLRAAKIDKVQGFNIRRWNAQGLEFWAVSDIDADELQEFVEKFDAAFHSASGT